MNRSGIDNEVIQEYCDEAPSLGILALDRCLETNADERGQQIRATGLGHRFHAAPWLFRDLNFRLVPGEIVGICGPSGSGKSTLLSLIAGFEHPVSGSVERRDIGRVRWVFQNPHGVPRRTAIDHVTQPLLGQGMGRVEAESQALAIMEDFHLTGVCARDFRELSGGEAQRLMLARAVASKPDLLLVDEPTAQLDQSTAADVDHTLSGIAQSDCIVAIATHDPNTRAACTRIIDLSLHHVSL